MDKNYIGVNPSVGSISPYMNIDPSYLSVDSEPQFVLLEGQARDHKRGRFELSFSQIGGSVFAGAAFGGVTGLYSGLNETKLAEITGSVRRTQLLNSVLKRGASSAQSVGVIALLYSMFGVVVSKARGADDEINTLTAATATGMLYKSPAGLKKSLRGGAVGLGLAAAYCLVTRGDKIKMMVGL